MFVHGNNSLGPLPRGLPGPTGNRLPVGGTLVLPEGYVSAN
jgi:hypothetical protein